MPAIGKSVASLTALIGICVIASSLKFVLFGPVMNAPNFWGNILVGIALVGIAGYEFSTAPENERVSISSTLVLVLLGLWLIVTPYVFEPLSKASRWSDIINGLLVVTLSGYNVYPAWTVKQADVILDLTHR